MIEDIELMKIFGHDSTSQGYRKSVENFKRIVEKLNELVEVVNALDVEAGKVWAERQES